MFIVDTKEKAYILGFIWADGYLFKKRNHTKLTIELTNEDLLEIKPIFDSIAQFSYYYRARKNRKPQGTLYTTNNDLCSFLYDNDYLSKSGKSPDKVLSNIDSNLQNLWWLGYFDGDGCLYINEKYSCNQLSFTSCINQNWSFVNKLSSNLNLKFSSRNVDGVNSYSQIRCCNKKDIFNFLGYIYNNNSLGLKRKHNKYLEFLQIYNNR